MTPKQWLTLSDGSILTRQEQFVLRQVAAGEIADLKQEFGEAEEDRRLRARFLEELLTGELKVVRVHRRGVRIKNAVVEELMDLQNAQVGDSVELDTCIFKESVSFRDAILEYLDLSCSHFLKAADFHRINVGSTFFCRNTIFEGMVNIASASIDGQLAAEGAKFLAKTDEVIFNGLKVDKHAFFDGAEFHGPIDCGSAEIRGQLTAEDAKFFSDKYTANFNAIHCNYVSFKGAEFHGPVDFVAAEIKGQFVALAAKFLDPNHKISFTGMQVGQDAFFQGCEFHGLVSFILIKIAGDLHLEPLLKTGVEMSTTFHGGVNFRGADIGGEFKADKAHFLSHTWVNFEAVTVGRDFSATGAIFAGPVNFSALKAKKNFYIDPFGRLKTAKTLFKGPANFSDLEVAGVFNADQAIFQSENVVFTGLKVGQEARFNGTIFVGGLVLKEGQINDLEISGLHRLSQGGLPLEEIVLNRTKIAHRLTIENIEVKRFDARNLEVKGPTELRRLVIKGEADFRDAAFYHLQVAEVAWLDPLQAQKQTEIYLDGMSYESVTTKTKPTETEKWPKLLAWLGLSRFNTQNYQELDAFFQRGGLRKWADKVYIAGKRRELGRRKWWDPARWLTRFFWGLLAGYGRKPGRTLWISMCLIILGAFILNPVEVLPPDFLNNLAGYHDNVVQPIALRLIVSFFSFVAAIPGWGGHLSLASPEFHLFVYLWFQRICGWILIPIGLAAVYTRLK
jgi:hypothetical protein